MSPHATLVPTFVLKLGIQTPPRSIGTLANGVKKQYIPIETASLLPLPLSTSPPHPITTAKTSIISGGDWATIDPSGKVARLDVRLVLDADGEAVNIEYAGLVKLSEEIGKVLGGVKGAKNTSWGGAVVGVRFETGEKWRELGEKVWVASGRFVVEDDGKSGVEYLISEVVGGEVPEVKKGVMGIAETL